MSRRKKLAIGALSAMAVGVSAPAWGFFSVTGTGAEGYAKADALGTPTVSATRVLGIPLLNIDALINFKVLDVPEGLAPTGYSVRTPGGTQVCHINTSTLACTALLNIGGDEYHIFADRGPWSSLVPAMCNFSSPILFASCTGSAPPAAAMFRGAAPTGTLDDLESAPPEESAVLAPSAPAILAADDTGTSDTDGITNEPAPRLIGTAPALSTVILSEGSVELGRADADADGAYSIKTPLTEGDHEVTAAATTADGTEPSSAASPITVDLTGPHLTAGQIDKAGTTRTVGGTGGTAAGDSGTVRLTADHGATPSSDELAIGGDGEYGTDLEVAAGETVVTLSQSDLAGNKTTKTVTVTLAEDDEDPTPSETTPPDPPRDKDDTPVVEEPATESPEPTSTTAPEEHAEESIVTEGTADPA